ncbi:GT-D fold domain-containing glycosyltransferase [Fructilactobacillus myrtifloralis]|uniref:GT-D fold domain-containing glycosyltransferase n=1 Tax=Fructilactobacillus myrtifloralis TaxID=2940301 RepID=A0ABY5BM13_9LACO|nr:GT-D fold domain-containing glycosyltransferase [Fructilactobacillus myrtifloralis]USS84720.1 GT-D fold domain-containing glycosyltransferase [Fructilactobacillus myrtifloralis]
MESRMVKFKNKLKQNQAIVSLYTAFMKQKTNLQFAFYRPPFRPKIIDADATLALISKNQLSISRYGDGELNWMIGDDGFESFEIGSSKLQNRLAEIIKSNLPNHLVGIPGNLTDPNQVNDESSFFWKKQLCKNGSKWFSYLDPHKTYYDADITRPYIEKRDKRNSEKTFNLLKQVWNNRDVLIVEGQETRFGVGNDLLANAHSIRRIECPVTNAFERYDEILKTIKKHVKPNDLVLAALGPTATVLAFDLCKSGFQTIDIGHADIEYEWFKNGATEKVPVSGKYVNEVSHEVIGEIDGSVLKDYQAQIIDKVEV